MRAPSPGSPTGTLTLPGELGEGVGEHLLSDLEDLPCLALARDGGRQRNRRTSPSRSATHESLLDEPIDDPDGSRMREPDRLAKKLHGAVREVGDRDQGSGGRARVPDGLLRLEPEAISDREGEGAE